MKKRIYVQIAEHTLGHSLPEKAVVHHVDGERRNNQTNNLVILQSQGEHSRLHKRMRILWAGGNPWTQQICVTCQQVKDLTDFSTRKATSNGFSLECRRCVADRRHSLWCEQTGRENRYLTPSEFSEHQRRNALAGWATRRAG